LIQRHEYHLLAQEGHFLLALTNVTAILHPMTMYVPLHLFNMVITGNVKQFVHNAPRGRLWTYGVAQEDGFSHERGPDDGVKPFHCVRLAGAALREASEGVGQVSQLLP